MVTDGIVSRLSETLDELERVALAIPEDRRTWRVVETIDHDYGVDRVLDLERTVLGAGADHDDELEGNEAAHIARWDPKAALGLVEAVRDVINEVKWARQKLLDGQAVPGIPPHPLDREQADVALLERTLTILARGFGVTEEASESLAHRLSQFGSSGYIKIDRRNETASTEESP